MAGTDGSFGRKSKEEGVVSVKRAALACVVCSIVFYSLGYWVAFYRSIPIYADGILFLSGPLCGCGVELKPCESCKELRAMTPHKRKSPSRILMKSDGEIP